MKIENIDIQATIKKAQSLINSDEQLSAATKSMFETRQVFDIDISRIVTEYRAQILESDEGGRFVASFPPRG